MVNQIVLFLWIVIYKNNVFVAHILQNFCKATPSDSRAKNCYPLSLQVFFNILELLQEAVIYNRILRGYRPCIIHFFAHLCPASNRLRISLLYASIRSFSIVTVFTGTKQSTQAELLSRASRRCSNRNFCRFCPAQASVREI